MTRKPRGNPKDNWGRDYNKAKYPVLTQYCDLATRAIVTVYDSVSEETRRQFSLGPGYDFDSRGVDAYGRTVVSRGRRAWCPTLDQTERRRQRY